MRRTASEPAPVSPLWLPGRERQAVRPILPEVAERPQTRLLGLLLQQRLRPQDQEAPAVRQGRIPDEKAADQALTKLKASLDTGSYVKPSEKLLAEYAPEVMARRLTTEKGLKPTTAATYSRYVEQDIVPSRLGEMRLTDIRRSHVNAWVADLTKGGRGAVTVRRALATLRMIFTQAVRDEIISSNPALMIDKPTVPNEDDQIKVWEPGPASEFLERCSRHRLGALFEVTIATGLRRGEICGLRWTDVDLDNRIIVVRHNRVSVDGRVQEQAAQKPLRPPHSASQRRRNGGPGGPWGLRQQEEREAAQEAWVGDGHVFTMEDGRALDPAYVTRLFQKIRKQGEPLPELTYHGLRHCYGSYLIEVGTDIAIVSKLMGHASISITADIYGHLVGTAASDAVNRAANLITRTSLAQPDVKTDAG